MAGCMHGCNYRASSRAGVPLVVCPHAAGQPEIGAFYHFPPMLNMACILSFFPRCLRALSLLNVSCHCLKLKENTRTRISFLRLAANTGSTLFISPFSYPSHRVGNIPAGGTLLCCYFSAHASLLRCSSTRIKT